MGKIKNTGFLLGVRVRDLPLSGGQIVNEIGEYTDSILTHVNKMFYMGAVHTSGRAISLATCSI